MKEPLATMPETSSVVLVDDHQFLLEGLKQRFDVVPDLDVIDTADTIADGIATMQRLKPDFAVVDYRLPDGNGISLVAEIRKHCPETICIIYTSVSLDDDIEHGADAVVIKELFDDQLIETMRTLRTP